MHIGKNIVQYMFDMVTGFLYKIQYFRFVRIIAFICTLFIISFGGTED